MKHYEEEKGKIMFVKKFHQYHQNKALDGVGRSTRSLVHQKKLSKQQNICKVCNKHCHSARDWHVHINKAHMGMDNYTLILKQIYKESKQQQIEDLDEKRKNIHQKQVKVPQKTLKKHQNTCKLCNEYFATVSDWNYHIERTHKGMDNYLDMLKQMYKDSKQQQYEDLDQNLCKICNRCFMFESHWKDHIVEEHGGMKNYTDIMTNNPDKFQPKSWVYMDKKNSKNIKAKLNDKEKLEDKSPKVINLNGLHDERTSNLDDMQKICEELDIKIVDSEDNSPSKKAKLDIDIGSPNKVEKCIQNESDSSKTNIQSMNENDIEPNIKFDKQFQKNNGNLNIKKETNDFGEFMNNMKIKSEIDDAQLQAGLAVLEEMGESFFTKDV